MSKRVVGFRAWQSPQWPSSCWPGHERLAVKRPPRATLRHGRRRTALPRRNLAGGELGRLGHRGLFAASWSARRVWRRRRRHAPLSPHSPGEAERELRQARDGRPRGQLLSAGRAAPSPTCRIPSRFFSSRTVVTILDEYEGITRSIFLYGQAPRCRRLSTSGWAILARALGGRHAGRRRDQLGRIHMVRPGRKFS